MSVERLYVGTHRRAHRDDPGDRAFGIYGFARKATSGAWLSLGFTKSEQPGWIALHPSGRWLYAAHEVDRFAGVEGGGLSAYAIDAASGSLQLLNTQRTPARPCHCSVDATGQYLLAATHGGGSVHLYRLDADGRIAEERDAHHHRGSSVHPRRQTQAHAHAVVIDSANRFVLVPDLGTDQVLVYELLHSAGKLAARNAHSLQVTPGCGPRHLVFGSTGRHAYLVNELSATIDVLAFDGSNGSLHSIQSLDLLPVGFAGLRSGAAIAVHPGGRYLYATTRSRGSSGEPPVRGLDALVWFAIDTVNGTLSFRGRVPSGGEISRSFRFDRSGELLYVAHQASGTIVGFRIDPRDGAPIATGEVLSAPVPVCLQFTR